jgi:hypothetical protein
MPLPSNPLSALLRDENKPSRYDPPASSRKCWATLGMAQPPASPHKFNLKGWSHWQEPLTRRAPHTAQAVTEGTVTGVVTGPEEAKPAPDQVGHVTTEHVPDRLGHFQGSPGAR